MVFHSSLEHELEKALPTAHELISALPLSQEGAHQILHQRTTIKRILDGLDPRILLIVGPCSIHDKQSALEYAIRLKMLAETVSNHFYVVMRTYLEKPRTIYGWKGFLYDPSLDGSHDIEQGLLLSRELLVELTSLGLPIATEFLEIITAPYISDCISWGCIGARTSNSPIHRQFSSTLPFPVGFKNTTDGSLDNAINGCLSAQEPHIYMGLNHMGEINRIYGPGNPTTHIVLRGGKDGPNYEPNAIAQTLVKLKQAKLPERVVIDCSHDNCSKIPERQLSVFNQLIHQLANRQTPIRGLMLESHLAHGQQPIHPTLKYGVSITDACIDWETTESLILKAYETLDKHNAHLLSN